MAVTSDGRFLYAESGGAGTVDVFAANGDGALNNLSVGRTSHWNRTNRSELGRIRLTMRGGRLGAACQASICRAVM
jgi:hypothetical protein